MIDFIKNLDRDRLAAQAKPLAIAAICFVAVFAAGYGVGKSAGSADSAAAAKRSLNYTTTNSADKTAPTGGAIPAPQPDPNNCYIKGSKSKIYHLPGGAFYDRTTPAACFNSEEEAQAAGYKKSNR